jgi:hypothetical protein
MTRKIEWNSLLPILKEKSDKFAVLVAQKESEGADILDLLVRHINPEKIIQVIAPPGKDDIKQLRAFLNAILESIDELPVHSGMETAVQARLPKLLCPRADFLIVHHAEYFGRVCMDVIRRDSSHDMPPTLLISYDNHIENTLLTYPDLFDRAVIL